MPEKSIAKPGPAKAAMWQAVRAGLRSQRETPDIEPLRGDARAVASFAQESLWLSEQLAGPGAQHNLCVLLHLRGRVDVDALRRALETLLRRHDILCARLEWSGDVLYQVVLPPSAFVLAIEPFSGDRNDLRQLAEQEAAIPFDLNCPPFLRARLSEKGAEDHALTLTFHHLTFDGWSFEVFMGELGELYGAFLQGTDSSLSPPARQYRDFAAWQRKALQGRRLQELTDFWGGQLSHSPSPGRLPADLPPTRDTVRRGACLTFTLPDELQKKIHALAASEAVTPFTLLLAAYQVLLSRHTGETFIDVATPVAQRFRSELRGLVGPLINTLVLCSQVLPELSFRHFLGKVQQTVADALAHQDFPFLLLAGIAPHWRTASGHFPLPFLFTYLNLPPSHWNLPGLTVEAENIHNGTVRCDLSLTMGESGQALWGQWEYDADRFDSRYIQSLARQWETLLWSIVADQDIAVSALPLLGETEIRELLALTRGPCPSYPRDTPIHRLFADVARDQPHATAAIFGMDRISYRDLNERAGRLAGYLHSRSIGPGDLAGVCLPPSIGYLAAVLAILKTGAAYVPLSPGEPMARAQAALGHSRLTIVLTSGGHERDLTELGAELIDLDMLKQSLVDQAADTAFATVTATQAAYVMFTSGSSGIPKAVCIPHRGVVRLARAANYARLDGGGNWLLLAPLAFDASTFELWGALLNGATLVIPPRPMPSLSEIGDLIRQYQIGILWLTSGLFELMLEAQPEALAVPRQLLVGGDVLSPVAAQRYLALPGAGRLINAYGPTENTTFSTFHPVCVTDTNNAIPIGRVLAHTRVYLLDDSRQPVPHGVIGDAWVAGDGLMLGYLHEIDAGADLVPDPFTGEPGALMYRTGDRMRLRADGNLEFMGRLDRQTKIRGFRIDPGEIEAVLLAHPQVAQAAVTVEGEGHGKRLVAYVSGSAISEDTINIGQELANWLRVRLPEPQRSAAIVWLPRLPLNSNGKLDRSALPRPATPEVVSDLPVDALEQQLAEHFAEVLGLPLVRRQDDFFTAGGQSLLALQLIARLESALSQSIPLAALFQHSTPASLAAHLRWREVTPAEPVTGLIEIRRGRILSPLFLVPGGHGGMLEHTLYGRLLSYLERDLSVYGLVAEAPLPDTVEALAAAYVARIRRLQPRGPYALAGECVGGVIAYEMARQLREAGESMALLLLLDTWCPNPSRARRYRWLQAPLRVLRLPAARWRKEWTALAGTPEGGEGRSSSGYGVAGLLCFMGSVVRWWRKRSFGRRYVSLAMAYRPQLCAVPLQLLLSETNHKLGLANDWEPFAQEGLSVWAAPGSHESYLRDTPEVAAQTLSACLDQVFGTAE